VNLNEGKDKKWRPQRKFLKINQSPSTQSAIVTAAGFVAGRGAITASLICAVCASESWL
jgi:hypothetical protein